MKRLGGIHIAAATLFAAAQLPGLAFAQTAPSDTSGATAEASDSSDEIIVTAERRDQALSRVPAAISAVSGEQLLELGVSNSRELQNVIPNIQVGPAGFAIRGVASADFTEKGDPSTAYNLDGIYIARPTEQTLTMFDVDRVEVLRGPQGTLYGRNATAGVVNVITNRPSDTFEGSTSVELGNFDTRRLTGMVNVPLGDAVSFRLAGAYNYHDGYTETHDGNGRLDDQDDYGIRAGLRFELSPSTTLFVSADYEDSSTNAQARIPTARALAQNDDDSLRFQNPGVDTYSDFQSQGITAELNSDLGFADLTYLVGYRESSWRERATRNDLPAPFVPFTPNGDFTSFQDHDQISHELRLASNGSGVLQWILGGYYFHEETFTAPNLLFPNFGFRLIFDLNATADTYAGFGQVTYSVTPDFRLTGGLRYTHDEKERTGTQQFVDSGFCGSNPCVTNFDGQYPGPGIDDGEITWRAGAEYDLTDSVLGYFTVSTGYKAGGFNDGSPADPSPVPFFYRPETITSYEAGIKGYAFDRALYFSASAFSYDYQDLQLGLVKLTGGAVTLNVPQADVMGLELEGYLRAGDNTRIDYSLAALDATYGDFFPIEGNTTINFNGEPLDRSPEFTARIGISHDFPLANGGRITGAASLKYSTSYVVTDGNTATQIEQESYTRTDLSLGYFAPGDQWFVQAFGRNLEDNRLLGVFELDSFTLTDPMQYGVRMGVNF